MRGCLIKGQEIKKDRKGIERSIRLEQNKWLFWTINIITQHKLY